MNAADFKPPDRIAHFDWLNQAGYTVIRWGGFIQQVVAINGGSQVTVEFNPAVVAADGDGSISILDWTDEVYNYVNGQLQYVNMTVPPEAAPFSTLR